MSEIDRAAAALAALDHIAADEAALLEELVEARADRDTYRALARQAIQELHERTRELEALRRSHHRVIDEFRALRVQLLRATEAAA